MFTNARQPGARSGAMRSGAQPAYSLVFAFIVMTVMMIVAGTTIENTLEKHDYVKQMEGAVQAKLAAESAAEMAVVAMKDYGAGYAPTGGEGVVCLSGNTSADGSTTSESDGSSSTTSGTDTSECTGWANYEVYASAGANSESDETWSHYLPIPGSGTAGGSDCSVRDSDQDVDQVCNWNKLMYGDSVTIPLYSADEYGSVATPAELSVTDWALKVRTPCVDPDGDYDTCERYDFDDGMTYEEDDSVIFWQVSGEDPDTGDEIVMVPDDGFAYNPMTLTEERTTTNTEIYESLIDDAYASNYIVLYDEGPADLATYDSYQSALQLNIVTPMVDLINGPIPYLEWQLVMSGTEGFADTKSVVVGEGFYEIDDRTFYFPYVITRDTTGESASIYTLSN
jgi:hypothetical protein